MVIKKVESKVILVNLCWFFLLLYPFNCTISGLIYPNTIFILLTLVMPIVILLFLNDIKRINLVQIKYLFLASILLVLYFFNNYYLKEGRYFNVISYMVYFSLIFILIYQNNSNMRDAFERFLKFFLLEHVIGTLFVQIFQSFYSTHLIPLLSSGNIVNFNALHYYVSMGYNAGFTAHYSTNGIYLAISIIYFFSKFMEDHKKSNLILTILSIISVLLTAKRAHCLFSILSCITIYILYNNKKILKKILLFIGGSFLLIMFFIIWAKFIPSITNVVNRFSETNLLNGREIYYASCINKWREHPIIGNGWGYFSYYFETHFYYISKDYHFLDAHNVFLQLLCEVGILGFTIICLLFIYIALISLKNMKTTKNSMDIFCFGYQIFFLLYCLSGNPLYDVQCYSIYFIISGLILSKRIKLK